MIPYLSEDKREFFACGNPIVISEDPKGLLVKWADGEMVVPAEIDFFGGTDTYSEGKEVVDFKSTSIVMNSGVVDTIWGSNKGPGTIDKVTIIMNDGTVSNLSAGCGYGANVVPNWKNADKGTTYIKETNVTINGGTATLVYGGTGSGITKVDKANFTMTGGTSEYVTGGNSNGAIKAVNMKVTGGKTTGQLSPCMRGTCGDIEMKVTGGEHAYVSVLGDVKGSITGKSNVGIYGGTVDSFMMLDGIENSKADQERIKDMTVKAAPGLLKKEDLVDSIVEDATLGEGAAMKTIRLYPFPHKQKRIFGILTDGEGIEMPAELPMSEHEIAYVLGMAHVYEVIGDKLVVLDEKNYKLDNSDAAAFTGKLPCDDCEISYPRKEEDETVVEPDDGSDEDKKENTDSEPATQEEVKEETPATEEVTEETK